MRCQTLQVATTPQHHVVANAQLVVGHAERLDGVFPLVDIVPVIACPETWRQRIPFFAATMPGQKILPPFWDVTLHGQVRVTVVHQIFTVVTQHSAHVFFVVSGRWPTRRRLHRHAIVRIAAKRFCVAAGHGWFPVLWQSGSAFASNETLALSLG